MFKNQFVLVIVFLLSIYIVNGDDSRCASITNCCECMDTVGCGMCGEKCVTSSEAEELGNYCEPTQCECEIPKTKLNCSAFDCCGCPEEAGCMQCGFGCISKQEYNEGAICLAVACECPVSDVRDRMNSKPFNNAAPKVNCSTFDCCSCPEESGCQSCGYGCISNEEAANGTPCLAVYCECNDRDKNERRESEGESDRKSEGESDRKSEGESDKKSEGESETNRAQRALLETETQEQVKPCANFDCCTCPIDQGCKVCGTGCVEESAHVPCTAIGCVCSPNEQASNKRYARELDQSESDRQTYMMMVIGITCVIIGAIPLIVGYAAFRYFRRNQRNETIQILR